MIAGPRWCRSDDELAAWLAGLPDVAVALDTEADSLHHYPEKVCLIQLSCDGTDLLVDPLAGVDPARLGELAGDASRRKVMHGADYDLRILGRDHGLEFRGVFDTMIAARLTGESQFGLAALLDKHFGVRLDKSLQRADWSRRPLTAAMAEYAAMDTRFLVRLSELLEARLRELGRTEWLAEECALLEGVRWSEMADEEPFRRVKGSARLDRRGLAVLRELVGWRESMARRLDRPPFKVLPNDVLLEIARVRPEGPEALPAATRPRAGRRKAWSSQDLLGCVRRAAALPEALLPHRRAATGTRPDPEVQQRLKRLARARDAVAQELGLEPSLLASRAVLEASVARASDGLDPWTGSPGWRRWQRGVLEGVLGPLLA